MKLNPAKMSPIKGIPLKGVLLQPLAILVALKWASYPVGSIVDDVGLAKDTPAKFNEMIMLIAKFIQSKNNRISHWILIDNHSPFIVN